MKKRIKTIVITSIFIGGSMGVGVYAETGYMVTAVNIGILAMVLWFNQESSSLTSSSQYSALSTTMDATSSLQRQVMMLSKKIVKLEEENDTGKA